MLHPPLGVEAEPEPVPGAPGAGAGTDAGTDAGGAPAELGGAPLALRAVLGWDRRIDAQRRPGGRGPGEQAVR